jgi:hypothetical protein
MSNFACALVACGFAVITAHSRYIRLWSADRLPVVLLLLRACSIGASRLSPVVALCCFYPAGGGEHFDAIHIGRWLVYAYTAGSVTGSMHTAWLQYNYACAGACLMVYRWRALLVRWITGEASPSEWRTVFNSNVGHRACARARALGCRHAVNCRLFECIRGCTALPQPHGPGLNTSDSACKRVSISRSVGWATMPRSD